MWYLDANGHWQFRAEGTVTSADYTVDYMTDAMRYMTQPYYINNNQFYTITSIVDKIIKKKSYKGYLPEWF